MRLKSVLSALGIAAALVIALDYVSFAATGNSAVLGKLNRADKATTFQRTTNGPAVSFVTKPGKQPFSVNRQAKVAKLNADLLDGRDSSSFATKGTTRILRFTTSMGGLGHTFPLGTLPAGKYAATYSVFLDGSAPTNVTQIVWAQCSIQQTANGLFQNHVGSSDTAVWNGSPGPSIQLSASGVIDTAAGATPELSCNSNRSWATKPASFPTLSVPVVVTLTPIEASTLTATTVP